jgi:hypothetical protein
MARARNIKPSFFQNEVLGEVDPLIRLFFIGLWTVADYKGCLEFRPKRLKAQILPYDDFDIEKAVNILTEDGFIRAYFIQEKSYLKITNFEKHQSPHKNEREQGSEIPDFIEDVDSLNQPTENKDDTEKTEKIGFNTDNFGTARADCFKADSLLLNPDCTHTDSARTGARAKSQFSLDECLRYAKTQAGITNPMGWAIKHHRTGESDAFIQAMLYPEPEEEPDKRQKALAELLELQAEGIDLSPYEKFYPEDWEWLIQQLKKAETK